MQGAIDILIAGSNAAQSIAIELILTREGHRVTCVSSGPQALSHIKALQPKLVLLDPDLNDMSGLEVCQRLRMDPTTAALPVVVITPDAHAVFRRKLIALGVTAVLSPPLNPRDIIDLTTQFNTGDSDEV
ncbi:response regulator [Pacificibacter sp. AS14]|uniref:response regulator n=1 Tax=Pacificibacter sp. AS14 TaxID=3135785 RepID=UPI00317E2CEB